MSLEDFTNLDLDVTKDINLESPKGIAAYQIAIVAARWASRKFTATTHDEDYLAIRKASKAITNLKQKKKRIEVCHWPTTTTLAKTTSIRAVIYM